jgi:hypothetical protein
LVCHDEWLREDLRLNQRLDFNDYNSGDLMKKLAVLLLALAAAGSAFAQQARPADVASVDSVIAALYDTISGPAGKPRDWDRLRSLFRPDSRMVVHSPTKTSVLTVEDYIGRVTPVFAKTGFFESEVGRKTEQFGQIAHVFSTYQSVHAPEDAKPFQRGINSIQLLSDGQRWWVASLVWQAESDSSPLPERYLQK